MKKLLVLVLLSVGFSVFAQSFGELFPVTNTRYPTASGAPRLSDNGRDFFLFWYADGKTRAAKFQDGFARGGHVVLDSLLYDVAWNGRRFLAVSTRRGPDDRSQVVIRQLDADAHPVGPDLTLAPNGHSSQIAVGRNSALVTYQSYPPLETRLIPIALDGTALGGSRLLTQGQPNYALASNGDRFLAAMRTSEGIRAMTLDRDGQPIGDTTLVRSVRYGDVDVASDGSKYLVAWCDDREMAVAMLTENGTFGSPLVIDNTLMNSGPLYARVPTVVWNGGGWTISYEMGDWNTPRVRIVQLDRSALKVLTREETPFGIRIPTAAAVDGRTLVAWQSGQGGSASLVELPLAAHEPQVASFSAAHQTLLTTTTSADATLIVWSEKNDGGTSIHAGVRRHDGGWSEYELPTEATPSTRAIAASDGRGFAVATFDGYRSSLFRLDAEGRPLAAPATLQIIPIAIAWNGTNYALVDGSYGGRGILVSPSGQVAPFIALGATFEIRTLTSDGTGFFASGQALVCISGVCNSVVRGVRLHPDLKRVDTRDLILTEKDSRTSTIVGAAWNGTEYVLIWADASGKYMTRVPPSRAYPIVTTTTESPIIGKSIAILRDGSIAIAGGEESSPTSMSRVIFLRNNGTFLRSFDIQPVTNLVEQPRLEPLADGGVAYVASSIQSAAPHDGTSRIATAIAKPAAPPPPSAPHVSVRLQNGSIVIDWSAPAGTVNGYRLEYRVDDDSWNEYEQWFGPNSSRKTIRQPNVGTQFAFRMRAFNDGGASPYSATAVTKPSRRRAVR